MAFMKAVAVDPEATGRLSLTEVEAPIPTPNEALVRVHTVSLNPGETRRAQIAPPGSRIGTDLAGIVETAAASGSGPAAGDRVVGLDLKRGAWAERVTVPVDALAVLPDGVSFADAAALPVAGLTAYHALRQGGLLLGQRVLVTGASGGVGHFGVQLARQAGETVVALVRRDEHIDLLKEAGAHEVVVDETGAKASAHGPYDLILESVGSEVLSTVIPMLIPGGTCVHYGASSGRTVTFETPPFFLQGRTKLYGLQLFTEFASQAASVGLKILSDLVADGRLRPRIEVGEPWDRVGDVAQQLLDRRFVGKAVLRVE